MKRNGLMIAFLLSLLAALYGWQSRQQGAVETSALVIPVYSVVIDPGHGGFDPGKVAGDIYEKDVNLTIALYLKTFLEQQDVQVVLTRQTDQALGNTKNEDMQRRLKAITDSKSDICVIIHQNSFSDTSVHGMQLFYAKQEESGLEAAGRMLESACKRLELTKLRPIKADDTVYLTKHATMPTVLVECGFLSNQEDLSNLTKEGYQKRLAWSLSVGIMQWLHALSGN